MKRCEHCGAEYLASFPSHCMANFHNHGRQTELLGRYVERAEKAEAEVERLKGLLHTELLCTMRYCELHEMAYQRGEGIAGRLSVLRG